MSRKRTADDMEQETDSATGLIQLSRNGDVIFEVGMSEEQRRIQVSSALLTMPSTAFVALLGPHFREGRNLGDAQNPATIPLPEDEPEAMSDLFFLLHHVPIPALATGRDANASLRLLESPTSGAVPRYLASRPRECCSLLDFD